MTDKVALCDCESWTPYLGIHNRGYCEALNEKEKRDLGKAPKSTGPIETKTRKEK